MTRKPFLLTLIILSILALSVYGAAAQGPQLQQAGGCVAGDSYDPSCDVNRDGDTDVVDLELVATHWGNEGTWTSDGAFWSLTGNAGTTPGTHFLGTTDSQPLELWVNGNRVLRLEPTATYRGPNLIGGYRFNTVTSGVKGATISGGGSDSEIPEWNMVTDDFGTVGGGRGNWAGNNAGSTSDAIEATVGGGQSNVASGRASTVSGGVTNTASGDYAAVPGGASNSAAGDYSFAAGRRAKANHQGAFVWADSHDADFASTASDQFWVRANGGARFLSSSGDYALTVNGVDIMGSGGGVKITNYGSGYGVYAVTAGSFAGYFAGNIFVNGSCTGCTLVYIGLNDGKEPLETGDLVAVVGVNSPLAGTTGPVMRVRRTDASNALSVIGVVQSKADIVESIERGELLESAYLSEGPAATGDYVFIVIEGITQVKADVGSHAIVAGQRLTVADLAGHVRAVKMVEVQGVHVAESAPVLGIALESLESGEGLIWVLVNPQ